MIILQEDTDKSFMKKHQPVVKQQATQWAESEAGITGALIDMNPYFPGEYGTEPTPEEKKKPVSKSGKPGSGSSASRPPSGKPLGSKSGTEAGDGGGKSNVENGESSEQGTMSTETRAALPGALKEIFARHHVCRYSIKPTCFAVSCNVRLFSPNPSESDLPPHNKSIVSKLWSTLQLYPWYTVLFS